jgi:hypothetical protein
MGQHLRKISAFSIAAATTSSSRRNMQNQTIGQVRPNIHALQLAVQGMAIEQGPQGQCLRIVRRNRRAGMGSTTLLAGRLSPAGINVGIA